MHVLHVYTINKNSLPSTYAWCKHNCRSHKYNSCLHKSFSALNIFYPTLRKLQMYTCKSVVSRVCVHMHSVCPQIQSKIRGVEKNSLPSTYVWCTIIVVLHEHNSSCTTHFQQWNYSVHNVLEIANVHICKGVRCCVCPRIPSKVMRVWADEKIVVKLKEKKKWITKICKPSIQ